MHKNASRNTKKNKKKGRPASAPVLKWFTVSFATSPSTKGRALKIIAEQVQCGSIPAKMNTTASRKIDGWILDGTMREGKILASVLY